MAGRVTPIQARTQGSLDRGRWQYRLEGGKNWLSQEVYRLGEGFHLWEGFREKGFSSGQKEVSRRMGRTLGQEELRVSERSP